MSRYESELGPWSRHFQEPWHNDALNPRFPYALRVAFLAYGTHKANGHAKFKQGEIGKVLSKPDQHGNLVPADRRTVYRAIREAIDFGFLAEGSKALCLVVPNHRVRGGMGEENVPCDRHPRPASASRRTALKAVS